jgi:hypothetical protein
LQNFQLRIGTYHYVHEMMLFAVPAHNNSYTPDYSSPDWIDLTFGKSPANVSFGSLSDPVTTFLGAYEHVNIKFLDYLAALFPFLFLCLVVAVDRPFIWTRIMLCFFILAVGKGLLSWITVVPDSKGWNACKARLQNSSHPAEWYAKKRSLDEILFISPVSRLCADMMYSGHTYFVAIFALGLHECARLAMSASPWHKRYVVESVIGLAAFLQQGVEIYYVLKSRFHYTSDIVMAVVITYLLYTNSVIAVVAAWWCSSEEERAKASFEFDEDDGEKPKVHPGKWFGTLRPASYISLGCCCCHWSQQFLYTRVQIMEIANRIEDATKYLDQKDEWKFKPITKYFLERWGNMLEPQSVWTDEDEEDEYYEDGDEEASLYSSTRQDGL